MCVHDDDLIISGEEREVERIGSVLRSKLLLKEQPAMAREGDSNNMLGGTIVRGAGNKCTICGDAKLFDLSVPQLGLCRAK